MGKAETKIRREEREESQVRGRQASGGEGPSLAGRGDTPREAGNGVCRT